MAWLVVPLLPAFGRALLKPGVYIIHNYRFDFFASRLRAGFIETCAIMRELGIFSESLLPAFGRALLKPWPDAHISVFVNDPLLPAFGRALLKPANAGEDLNE